jgi:multidrug efflux system membrane fusion protein
MSEPYSGLTPGGLGYRAPPPRKRPAWRTLLWILVAILAAIAIGWLVSPHGAQPGGRRGGGGGGGPGGGRRPPTVVGLAVAAPGDMPIELTALGTVTSRASVVVRTRIAGTLTKVFFREGQMVRAGDPLVEVDPRPYAIALAQSQAQLLRDQASLASARVDLKRYQTLKAEDSIAGQTLDTQAALVKQDEGTVKADEASVANARLNLAYCHVTAPVSGRVGLRQVDAGNYVSTGDTNGLVNITQIDPIDVVFTLPEDVVPQVTARISAGAVLSVTALDRTGGTALSQGTLSTLDNQIDTSTGTVKAKAAFSNTSRTLFPNQFVNVTLLVDTLRGAIIVPAAAVRHGSKGDFVYTIQSDPLDGDTAKVVMVKLGPTVGERAAILDGLQAGDRVITDGGDRLSDGATVVLPGQKQPNFAPQKKPGFFSWLGGLFGKKPAANAAGGGQAAASGGDQAGGGAPGAGGGGGRGRMQAMIAQLGLDPAQQAKATAIFADARQKAQADPTSRRAVMKDAMDQLTAILTPAQKAKLVDLRASGAGAGGTPPGAPTTTTTTAPAQSATPGPSAPPAGATGAARAQVQATNRGATAAPPVGAPTGGGPSGGGGGGGSGRMQKLIADLGLDAGQQTKANAIFAEARQKAIASGGDPDARRTIMRDAFAKLETILRPDQKAKLDALRAQRAQGGGG